MNTAGGRRQTGMADERAPITTFLTDLAMGESARWHDGRFWCSDWVAGEILAAGGFGFSCTLGGPDGRTLFMVVNGWNGPENIGKGPRTGRVDIAEVDVPATGAAAA